MTKYKRTVGLFYIREQAERALLALKDNGFNLDRVTFLARDADRVVESLKLDVDTSCDRQNEVLEGVSKGAGVGTILGSVGGLLIGLSNIVIPGIGSIVVAGSAASTIASTLAGAGTGALAGGKLGGLINLGIPQQKTEIYGKIIAQGGYLVMVRGKSQDIINAEKILQNLGIQKYGTYDAIDLKNDKVVSS